MVKLDDVSDFNCFALAFTNLRLIEQIFVLLSLQEHRSLQIVLLTLFKRHTRLE